VTARVLAVRLIALALQTIVGPMVAIARADGRPGPEALVTLIAQPLAVALAATRPTLDGAVTAFAIVITASLWGLWVYLRHRLGVSGPATRWLAPLAALTAGAAMVGWAAHAVAVADRTPWTALVAAPALIVGASAALALGLGMIPAAERRVLRGVLDRTAPPPRP
jgi:hypothetical protein